MYAFQIKKFFAQGNRNFPGRGGGSRGRRAHHPGGFKSELEEFKQKLNQEREKKEREEKETLKPLPDILSTISKKIGGNQQQQQASQSSAAAAGGGGEEKQPAAFEEPEAPPNSVERPLNAYEDDDDDFLHCDTNDIELF